MPSSGKKAQASATRVTSVVSHRPQREQCSWAGNLLGQPAPSMGRGAEEAEEAEEDDDETASLLLRILLRQKLML